MRATRIYPLNDCPAYVSSHKRHPRLEPVWIEPGASELTGPTFERSRGQTIVDMATHDGGRALGQRIVVAGHVRDEQGRPVRNTLLEIWQANAAGRFDHENDAHDAPLDPHFHGSGRIFTGDDGEYVFETIKPGAYPWRNHPNAWRPAHIHFSLFGPSFGTRLVTQMYFPGDPLLALDPILASIPDDGARARMISTYDHGLSREGYALGFRWDVVLAGRYATPFENAR